MTVLSADFQGFTAFAAKRDAEEVHEFIDFCWKQLAPVVESHHGYIEKYIGDAILALFGTEQTYEEDPAAAVRAGLAMQACLRQLETAGHRPMLPLRVGIHTGLVVIQSDAATGGFQAVGDTVNVTDRLQKLAVPGQVLISQETFRHVAGLFEVEPPQPYRIEGKTEPLLARVVLRARPRALAHLERGVEGAVTRMVGREQELELLQTLLGKTLDEAKPQVVTVNGEAGMGKSRLLREFLRALEQRLEPPLVFSCRATAEMPGSPFALWRELLAGQFEILETDSATEARKKLEIGVVSALAKRNGEPRAGEPPPEVVAHFLGHLAGLDFSASPHLQGCLADTQELHRRAFDCASCFFTALGRPSAPHANRRGLVIIGDDFHWSDEGSVGLFHHLAASCAGAVFVLCLARPEFFEGHPDWEKSLPQHTLIRLGPLAPKESLSLVEQVLQRASEIPTDWSERIIRSAEGNPFYIEEMIKMLIERGQVRRGVGLWTFEQEAKGEAVLPTTLTGILQARLDALQPQERLVAQRASVLGRVFWDTALQHLQVLKTGGVAETPADNLMLSPSQITGALEGLCRKEIVCRNPGSSQAGAVEYSFNHDLLRSVAYEGLLKKSRQGLHERAALWLIRQGGERVVESASVIAGHFDKAGRTLEAAEWYGRAGKQAAAGHLPAMAAESFSKALELSSGFSEQATISSQRLEWFDGLAEAQGSMADFDRAREAYLSLREAAASAKATIPEIRSWNGLAFLYERQGLFSQSIEAANRAIELCERHGSAARREELRALYFKGWAYYRLADAQQVLALAAQAAELAREQGDRAALGRALKLNGVAHLQLSHFEEADRLFQEGLKLAQETGDFRTVAAMWSNRGETARVRGDFSAAVALYEQALQISREIGSRESELIYMLNLSAARIGLGKLAQAEADLRALIAPAASAQSFIIPEIYTYLAEACCEQGKIQEALEYAQRAVHLSQATSNILLTAEAWRMLGRAKARGLESSPDRSAAVGSTQTPVTTAGEGPDSCFEESLRIFRSIGARGEEGRTLRIWAELDMERGRTGEAGEKLLEARKRFMELGMTAELEKAERIIAEEQ